MDKGDKYYYADIVKSCGVFEVYDMIIRTVEPTYFVGVDIKSHRAFLFDYESIGNTVFAFRQDAVDVAKRAQSEFGHIKLTKMKLEDESDEGNLSVD